MFQEIDGKFQAHRLISCLLKGNYLRFIRFLIVFDSSVAVIVDARGHHSVCPSRLAYPSFPRDNGMPYCSRRWRGSSHLEKPVPTGRLALPLPHRVRGRSSPLGAGFPLSRRSSPTTRTRSTAGSGRRSPNGASPAWHTRRSARRLAGGMCRSECFDWSDDWPRAQAHAWRPGRNGLAQKLELL